MMSLVEARMSEARILAGTIRASQDVKSSPMPCPFPNDACMETNDLQTDTNRYNQIQLKYYEDVHVIVVNTHTNATIAKVAKAD